MFNNRKEKLQKVMIVMTVKMTNWRIGILKRIVEMMNSIHVCMIDIRECVWVCSALAFLIEYTLYCSKRLLNDITCFYIFIYKFGHVIIVAFFFVVVEGLDTSVIMNTGRRTRGVKLDYTKADAAGGKSALADLGDDSDSD